MGILYANVGGQWVAISQSMATEALVGSKVAKTGDTMTGPLFLSGVPNTALQAANKGYVDTNTFQVTPASRTWVTVGGTLTTMTSALGWAYFIPASCGPCSIDGLGVEVTTAGAAGSVSRLGIYTSHPSRIEPYSLWYDAGQVASATTGFKSITFAAQSWPGGWMWLVVAAQSVGTPTYRGVTGHGEPWVAFAIDQTPPNLGYRGWAIGMSGAFTTPITPGLSGLSSPRVSFHVP